MKFVKLLVPFLIICLVFVQSVDAWGWTSHSQIVDVVYSELPSDVQ